MDWKKVPRGTIRLTPAQAAAVLRALARPDPGLVFAFEDAFARHVGARHAIAVASGKAALAVVLRGLGARPGDGVVLASYNVPEVPAVLAGMGLRPRFADLDSRTFNLDPDEARAAVDGRCRFLLATHLYGHPADLQRLEALARDRELVLVEDCAQALGARWRGRPVGTLGRAAIYSFGLMKNLNTLRGGMVVTDDDDLAGRIREALATARPDPPGRVARDLGKAMALSLLTRPGPFSVAVHPFLRAVEEAAPTLPWRLAKMRPEAWERGALDVGSLIAPLGAAQAACGLAGLPGVGPDTRARRDNAAVLRERLAGLAGLTLQEPLPDSEPAWTQFVVRVRDRAAVRRRLLRDGVDTTMGYLRACHRIPAFAAPDAPACPHSEALERDNLYLPCSPDLTPRDMERIARALRRALDRSRFTH